jgi:hypothetical protein
MERSPAATLTTLFIDRRGPLVERTPPTTELPEPENGHQRVVHTPQLLAAQVTGEITEALDVDRA